MRSRRQILSLRALRIWSVWTLVIGASAFGQIATSKPVEPWADPALKATRGLVFWLDAGRLNDARKAHGLPEVSDGIRVDRGYDASGNARDLAQPRRDAQPEWFGGALRFDGEATHLETAAAHLRLKEFTLFVVAAPFRNAGGFPGLFAMNQKEQEDFTSGLTLDLGAPPTKRFDTLNVEGKGFNGASNLLDRPSDFDLVRRLAVTSAPGAGGTRLFVDGVAGKSRDRAEGAFEIDQLLVGARRFGFPPYVQGFFEGDVFQVLLYDRILDESERKEVDTYLANRIGSKTAIVHHDRPKAGKSLVRVENPPPVQVLAPGFIVKELPIDLANVNNVKYRADGKLVALTYGGDIFLLSDADGDGIEETSVPFFEANGKLVAPIGMALTPAGYPLGDGVFVASKGKVSLILDADRDGKADEEKVIASGWTPLWVAVDALGVAIDREGSVYFGLGTDNFIDPLQIDRTGKAAYRLTDVHGTIQKISPDFRRRETIATGFRFPVALAINQAGDLFGTDQEGATWVPNGNAFDELMHIQTGRHYGFPAKHPKHLPSVNDEPNVVDYGPQHQSACGLNFNEPVNGGPIFGPASWAGDAFVTGYSRGKLWRTELFKTPAGYVARNHLFAALSMLTVDACVSPQGTLVVATHSGLPDWGSGPKGHGKLYKIIYEDREAPQPVLAWAAGPTEVRIAFDRPLDPDRLKDLAKTVAIEYGEAVRAADRFESLRPGYMIVARQLASPRARLEVLSTQVPPDRRSIVLTTTPHPSAVSYALTLPGLKRPGTDPKTGALRQVAAVDLGYDLTGVEAAWTPEQEKEGISTWLPHLDLGVARRFTARSFEHDRFWETLKRPGRLTLETKLDLWQMLRPAIQPGADPGYTLPDEEVIIELVGSGPIEVTASSARVESLGPNGDGRYRVRVTATSKERSPLPIRIVVETGEKLALDATYSTREDPRPRAFQLRRFLLPWASLERKLESVAALEIPELRGGDWARGRALFSGEVARCSTCHSVRGHGGRIGPDLSNLIHRDYASVLRDIHTPNAAINPDYIAYAVELKDGRVLQGAIQTAKDRLIVSDTTGRQTAVAASDVERMTASSASIMPEGLDATLGPAKLRDLLTFLLTSPIQPAPIERDNPPAPPARSRAEVDAALAGSLIVEKPKRLTIVLTDGPKDHGPGEHDYPLWRKRWEALLTTDETIAVETADAWPSAKQLGTADVVVFYSNNPAWNAAKAAELDRFLARGGGLVLIHYAVEGHKDAEALADRIGLAWQGGKSKFRHGPLEVDFSKSKHPIARNFGSLRFVDESYWDLLGKSDSIDVIGSGVEEGRPRPLFWAKQTGKGRVFVSIPGHYTWTFDDPLFRLLILRGVAWTAHEPVDRFNGLATLGARVEK